MSESYPLPSYAAYVWAQGDQLVIQFPPLAQGDQSSTINFHMTERGIAALLRIMQERGRASDLRIGTSATPTRREVERAIESDEAYKAWIVTLAEGRESTKAEKEQAQAELAELGL